ncbi:transcriptional regulator [Brevibacillus invocatus]|uniref:Transcriptional regulator n=1 Tax=Brevibacillus invocatus TaxID=173959 RepID=A0A3M8C2L5_9BACL|nr:transcriptional regulator [Brevibacillus invocatus]RNB69950.1 transcriptional regulator [Brevibacillus invocatus]
MDPTEFGRYLKSLRKAQNLTLTQLGKLIGYSNPYLSQIENGQKGIPSPDLLRKLSGPLNADFFVLMQKAGHLPNQDYQAILNGMLQGIIEITGEDFSVDLIEKLEPLKMKYDAILEEDFEFSPLSLRELMKNSSWRQEWKQEMLTDIIVTLKNSGNTSANKMNNSYLELSTYLEQTNITYKGNPLTEDDRKLILDMLNRIYPDQKDLG